ncbi:MAG TPA: hypothetical protein DD389_02635 [Candidatus Marinimicrobia bacterium]|nr:hypothetical protein [Candidatus Neomarinimicrobiota bacterium]
MRLAVTLCLCSCLFGLDVKKTENPCQSELIIKARKEGMRSIKPAELPQYIIDLWFCRKEAAGKRTMQLINKTTYEADQENSAKMQGFTSTCAYCASVSVVFFYMSKISGN